MSNVIFARVQPDGVRIVETYRYEQTLGLASRVSAAQAPVGQIKVAISYDGYQSFTRQAYADVRRQYARWLARAAVPAPPSRLRRAVVRLTGPAPQIRQRIVRLLRRGRPEAPLATPAAVTDPAPPTEALIGHLLLDNYDRTDLGSRYDLYNHYGALPLQAPIRGAGLDNLDQLRADRHRASIIFDYMPRDLAVKPLQVGVQVGDMREGIWPDPAASPTDILAALKQAAEASETQNDLRFSFRVEAYLTRSALPTALDVTLKKMWLEWPLPLSVDHQVAALLTDQGQATSGTPAWTASLRFNLQDNRLEWSGAPLHAASASARPDLTTWVTEPMHLVVRRPADLYFSDVLTGQVELELSGLLLSGVQALYFDGIGRRLDQVKLEKLSRLQVSFKLALSDLLAQREVPHFRQVVVPHVSLRGWRLSELEARLTDSGFHVTRVLQSGPGPNGWLAAFGAEPIAKPQSLQVWVLVDGSRRSLITEETRLGRAAATRSDVSIQLHCLSRGEHLDTALALNRLQTALTTHFEQMGARH